MIHVLFSSSAAGTLRQVLRSRGRQERVVDLTEWLNWGPIASDDFQHRAQWLSQNVPSDDMMGDWEWIIEHAAEFKQQVGSDPDRLIWIAPRSAHEQAGLYWYLEQFGGVGANMIIADYSLGYGHRDEPPSGLGVLSDDVMAQLLDNCPLAEWNQSRFPGDKWRSLMADDALLRIVEDGTLRSVSSDYLDKYLLQRIGTEWTKSLRVIGYAMGDIWGADHGADDLFLLWRLRELIRSGAIVCNDGLPTYPLRSDNMPMVRCAD